MAVVEIELGKRRKPRTCDCCGAKIHTSYGFVYRDNVAFAVYQAAWSDGHPESQVNARIEIGGDWGVPDTRPDHVCFGLLIFRNRGGIGFSFLEPHESVWPVDGDSEGEFLSRSEALAHPLKSEIFHVAEHLLKEDRRIADFLERHPLDA